MMRMLARLVLGLFVLKAVVASPRFARQLELDSYESSNYDEGPENLNGENVYEYGNQLTIDEPQIEIGTLAPPDYSIPASMEEEEDLSQKPQLIPQGSGGSGLLMGPNTQGEEELPLIPTITPQEASGSPGESGVSGDSGIQESEDFGPTVPGVTIIPDTEKEDELFLPTTEIPPESGGKVDSGPSGYPEVDLDIKGMPTCLLCTCLGSSVYCDDVKLTTVPPLPKETTHFYARYNQITMINKGDFAQMNKLKRIDLTANAIKLIADDAFSGLPALEELVLRENSLAHLPAMPTTMTLIDGSHNNIGATGIHKEAFKDMTGLLYLYLTDNHINHIPVPLPDSLRSLHLQRNNIQMMHEDTFCNLKDFNYIRNSLEDIRLDGNPINLSNTPQAYICLPRVPIGALI
ncbi:epiphycan isoform X2 [Esox lucius]|uniref:epiphycan isoform X2 n=1 Tax=Esox lucius TaxID=8010 RepID=UPI0010BDA4C2|nr:epiphycan isoform X2 [Esox lucius]